ncbi:shieldin complex subunit 2 isoform X1 [Chelonia mydas]|uniref:shieldin complex subunit 2 isoform X1 n=1 Tax=Chelonia mydas TaxID=8469 RepID=UPI001CA9C6A6|nr:shieldin complex subunit 2 isoform X1 [Chelonia mydas]XP_043408109.1 shieldin complex subunit 2 isoform X1 [Chelonia mydas]XP_043408110.1 shieldin complex subunit 2 isoform X1 [Chelonia mydas]XP_043408111.1 shieldin complex subunit 2 isoform X1 [Chelonia mydas]XP_043408112.1 shieldin complex subunit 2 isoform X1 [Chelonia mydas]XP_043408113.1 shieldin complex subunit 2 isoform X1 [Chelonia mydas]
MSGRPQIHIFLGAPIIPTPLEVSEEQSFSVAATETWKELHLSSDKHAFHLFAGKCKSMGHVEHQAPDPRDSTVYTRDHFSVNSEQGRFGVADYLTSCVPVGGGMKTHGSTLKRTGDVTSYCSQISGDRDTCKNMIQVAYQQLPHIFTKTDGQYTRPSNDCLPNLSVKGVRHLEDKCCDISDLVSSTKQISIHLKSMGKEDVPSDNHSVHHEHLSQYLEMFFPKIAKESKTKKTLRDCSDFAISTDTEFLSIMMSSQVAILSQKPFKEQNQMQREAMKLKGIEGGKKYRENKVLNESFQTNFVVGACINVPESDHQQESANSLELFSSESAGNIICLEATRRETSSQENAEDSQELVSYEQLLNEIRIEPLSSGILCSQEDNYYKGTSKRTRTSEDALSISYSTLKTQQKSKRAKLVCSPTSPETKVDQEMLSRFLKLQKNPLLLKNCSCKSQKYSVLVTVVHPCHVKEIQIKSRPKSSSKVPIATIVVIDQSDIERKVVLWRAAAFWSLTVFPGDIVLLTDVTVFENHWYGEKMLQSTFTSQLFNLGSCSAIDPKQCETAIFSHVVDVDGLQDLLAYVSSKFAYLKDLPHRQPQKLDSIQHVQLDQLQPDTLVHSVLKLVSITLLTESVYSYKGEKQRKIILTVEQIRDQHYLMVLWGAGAAWCPQLQRKKDHIWEFKYLLAQRSSISGDIELHTTPWSSCECLFDDDKRAVEFKEKFQKSEKSLMKMTNLSTHLEEKCSGVIQLKAHVLDLKFTIATPQYKQLILDADTSLECILASLPMIIYSGCAKCGLELQTDENKIYKQCLRCLPFNKVRKFYRPALMTAEDKGCEICIQVVSELMEKIFLNIPADWLNRFIVPPSDTTYGMIVADLCHSLLADTEASYLLDIRSHFVLDENSYPLQQDFFLLDFHPDL